MMETDAIREQRRLKFLAKMEKKDQLNKNKFIKKPDTNISQKSPYQIDNTNSNNGTINRSPYNQDNNNDNGTLASKFTPINNIKKDSHEYPYYQSNLNQFTPKSQPQNSTSNHSSYVQKYTNLTKLKQNITTTFYIKKITLLVLIILHCLQFQMIYHWKTFLTTVIITELTAIITMFKINSQIKKIAEIKENIPEENNNQFEQVTNFFVSNFGFVDSIFSYYNIAFDLISDFSFIALINVLYFLITSYLSD